MLPRTGILVLGCAIRRGRRRARGLLMAVRTVGTTDPGEGQERPRTSQPMLDVAADESVSEGQDRDCHDEANGSSGPPLPKDQRRHQGQQRQEEAIAAQERHDGIEDRIRQLEVDEAKQFDVESLEPTHPADSLTPRRQLQV